MPLSDFLCWPATFPLFPSASPPAAATRFLLAGDIDTLRYPSIAFHPDLMAERLSLARRRDDGGADAGAGIRAREGIPPDIRRAIDGNMTDEDRRGIVRPRVIFTTPTTRESAEFRTVREAFVERETPPEPEPPSEPTERPE